MAVTYKTEGRKRLLEFLLNHPDKQFTVEELCAAMGEELPDGTGGKVSKSSLYRRLSELCEEGTVRKYRSDGQASFVYQFVGKGDCCHHFHLKCLVCGRLVHLDCGLSEELLEHIRQDHGFRVDSGRSMLYGCCEDCAPLVESRHLPVGCDCRRPHDHSNSHGCTCEHH